MTDHIIFYWSFFNAFLHASSVLSFIMLSDILEKKVVLFIWVWFGLYKWSDIQGSGQMMWYHTGSLKDLRDFFNMSIFSLWWILGDLKKFSLSCVIYSCYWLKCSSMSRSVHTDLYWESLSLRSYFFERSRYLFIIF